MMREGDHIMTEDGLSGIVVRVEEKTTQVEIARFPSEDHRRPALVVINDITRQLILLLLLLIIILILIIIITALITIIVKPL